MADETADIEVLQPPACWALLRSAQVGRLAVVVDGAPDIFPINYADDHGTIVFRTAEGTKLSAAVLHQRVAFEVDGYDAGAGVAWSVVVKGTGAEVRAPHDLLEAVDLPLFPWQDSPKPHVVRIDAVEVTGRRFPTAPGGRWGTPLRGARRAATE